ncbi:hypothetical protein JCM33374_g5583 [Metschnikowia sp. JCM 33374]|nr:hypothetical protein JCM33374_g5583 [Metschnikowia sp. JCM 33374]
MELGIFYQENKSATRLDELVYSPRAVLSKPTAIQNDAYTLIKTFGKKYCHISWSHRVIVPEKRRKEDYLSFSEEVKPFTSSDGNIPTMGWEVSMCSPLFNNLTSYYESCFSDTNTQKKITKTRMTKFKVAESKA